MTTVTFLQSVVSTLTLFQPQKYSAAKLSLSLDLELPSENREP